MTSIMICPWCKSANTKQNLSYPEAGISYFHCNACTITFADDTHQHHNYERYDYTKIGNEQTQPSHSLEVGFNRDSQAEYLYERYRRAVDLPGFHPKSLLDVGCGPGDFLAKIRKYDSDMALAGLDPSLINVSESAKYAGINVKKGFWEDELVERFDVITMFGNLMLHKNPKHSINLAYERLNSGGILLVDIKNPRSTTRSILRSLKFALPDNRTIRRAYKQAFHGMPWGIPTELATQTLKLAGFNVLAVRQFPGRNAALSDGKSVMLKLSESLDRTFQAQPWVEFLAIKDHSKL